MKKNILIGVLTFITLTILMYSFVKADEADKARIEAVQSRDQAVQLQMQADQLRMEAANHAAEAKRQEAIAIKMKEQLEACKAQKMK